MYPFLILLAAGILFGIGGTIFWYFKDLKERKERKKAGKWRYSFLQYNSYNVNFIWQVALGAFVALCVVWAITSAGIGESDSLHTWNREGYIPLVAINDGSSMSGDFFLGCGSIDEVDYYFYYYNTSDGGIKRSEVPVKVSTIYEVDTHTPRIEIYKFEFESDSMNDWLIDSDTRTAYKIYVPKGSVRRHFTFDLEK